MLLVEDTSTYSNGRVQMVVLGMRSLVYMLFVEDTSMYSNGREQMVVLGMN